MKEMSKKVSILQIISISLLVLGFIFGLVGICTINYGDDKTLMYVLVSVLSIATIVMLLTSIISLVGYRKAHYRTIISSAGRASLVQFLAPFTSFVLAMVGIFGNENGNRSFGIAIVIIFVLCLFSCGLIARSLEAYRKDKENHLYTMITSFVAAGFLTIFLVVSLIASFMIKGTENIGWFVAFSSTFVIADIISYIALGLLAKYMQKNGAEMTAADVDSKVIDTIAQDVKDIKNQSSDKVDNVAEIRRYKALLDDGIITQEEFEKKKKELL